MVIVNFIINQFVLKRLKRFTPAIVGLGDGCLPEPIYDGNSDEIAHLATAFNTMANQVRRRETENERLSTELRLQSMQRGELFKRVISAQEDERKRVARELHDGLGQALSGLSFQAEAIEHLVEVDPERTRRQLQSIRSQVAETTRQMYDLIFDLRPSTLDDMGLVVALRAYAERLMKDHDIQLQLRSEGLQQRMPIAVETSLYRIYQEALTNIVRHAHASQVRLTLSECQSMFTGKIIDNGIGFDPLAINATGINKHGLGLLGMQERVAGCDGTLNIQSHPGCGTRILIRVPLQRQS
jgi:signal transduction histidine kinase